MTRWARRRLDEGGAPGGQAGRILAKGFGFDAGQLFAGDVPTRLYCAAGCYARKSLRSLSIKMR